MERIIEFLESLFSPLTNILGSGLEFFYSFGAPWWLSIVILTVIVRSLLFPLTIKQVKSMRAMQDLKPEMDRLRAKYKDNRQKQQEELMKLYQERQVNPLGGCFPLLVQLPVFIAMFYVIRSFGDTHESFTTGGILWFQDLSVMDPYYILPILSAVTMLGASEITSKHIDPQQRWLMRLLPVVFTIFLLTFPAGLFVYWITSNLVTLAQNYLIYNHGPGRKSPADTEKRQAPRNTSDAAPESGSPAQDGSKDGSKSTRNRRRARGSGRKRRRRR
jgi:YidC/Oxa1 family membrane protein insertase